MSVNLVDLLRSLFFNPEETQRYLDNPSAYLREAGVESVSYEEINEAAVLACSNPVSQGASVSTGGASVGSTAATGVGAGSGMSSGGAPGGAASAAPPMSQPAPPPPPPPPADMPPVQAMEQVVNYYVSEVSNVTNVSEVTNVDDRDTFVDSSVNTNVLAGDGSDVHLDIDNDTATASGDGAIAAGGDIENANTGTNAGVIGSDNDIDDSIFGDGNVVITDSENVAFGEGSTVTDINVGDGNLAIGDGNVQAGEGGQAAGRDLSDDDTAIAIRGDANGANFGAGSTVDNSVNDSYNQDNSVDLTVKDSFNQDNDVTVRDSYNQDNDGIDVDDSFNGSFNEDNDGVDIDIDDSLNRDTGGRDESFARPDPIAEIDDAKFIQEERELDLDGV